MASLIDKQGVGKRLEELRKVTGLNPSRFAEEADVDQSQYAKIEKGKLPITVNILDKIVAKYGLDKEWILYGTIVPRGKNINQVLDEINHWRMEIDATLTVLTAELAAIKSDYVGAGKLSFSSAFQQLKKDIENEKANRVAKLKKE